MIAPMPLADRAVLKALALESLPSLAIMDLLGGYSSGGDADSPASSPGPPRQDLGALPQPAGRASQKAETLAAARPHAKLTGPRPARVFKVPLDVRALIESDDEEDQQPLKAVKRAAGAGIRSALPPPQHSAPAEHKAQPSQVDSDEEEIRQLEKPLPEELALGQSGNEAFRMPDGAAELPGDSWPDAGLAQQPDHASAGADAGPSALLPSQQNGASSAPTAAEDDLVAALAQEAAKAQRRGRADPFANMDLRFKEVNQQQLTHMNAAARADANATRTAFGADYEQRLRSEAGSAPDKLSRRKHQISSLYHQAKIKELEMLETRTQGLKTKGETHAKYGW